MRKLFSNSAINKASKPIKFHLPKLMKEFLPKLFPPVSNHLLFADQLKVMLVGGPNQRDDYHIEKGEELFYQIKGSMQLKMILNGKESCTTINEGEVYLLAKGIPHSPQRFKGTIGFVFERQRYSYELDCLRWYHKINDELKINYEEYFHCTDLGSQLKIIIDRYNNLLKSGDNFQSPIKEHQSDQIILMDELNNLSRSQVPFDKPTSLLKEIEDNVKTDNPNESAKSKTMKANKLFDSEFVMIIINGAGHAEVNLPPCKFPHQTRDYFLWQMQGDSEIHSASMPSTILTEGTVTVLNSNEIKETTLNFASNHLNSMTIFIYNTADLSTQ